MIASFPRLRPLAPRRRFQCAGNHTMAYDWVKSIAHYLQATGYTTHLSGKKESTRQ